MIFFDVTKGARATHRSGLTRVSDRLRAGLGAAAAGIAWDGKTGTWTGLPSVRPEDWILTTELFTEAERPGFTAFLRDRPCRMGAVFHDAIPLKHPHITWPQSVARHPAYLKMLAGFDRIWAVSRYSRDELTDFWRWQRVDQPPPVDVIALGADFDGAPRGAARADDSSPPRLLCLGILEPRKNQAFLLEVCAELWRQGLAFELHVVGRVNPHFGRPIVARLAALRKIHPRWLHYHEAADDASVARLFAQARATVFPTLAEGCGLPLLESLWRGVPCVCSDLPVLRENAAGGGCLPVPAGDAVAWQDAVRRIVTDDALHQTLSRAAAARPLPTWAAAAATLRSATLTSSSPA